jgi:hypothetical protein
LSRYELTPTNPRFAGLEIAVGWDRPLTTFYGQVSRPAAGDGEDEMLLWVGTMPAEIASVEALAAALAKYVTLPADIGDRLKADRLADIDSGPTRFQRDMLAVFGTRR